METKPIPNFPGYLIDQDGNAKLNVYKVSWVKQLLATGSYTNCQIAKVFRVGLVTIYNIKFNRAWKEVV